MGYGIWYVVWCDVMEPNSLIMHVCVSSDRISRKKKVFNGFNFFLHSFPVQFVQVSMDERVCYMLKCEYKMKKYAHSHQNSKNKETSAIHRGLWTNDWARNAMKMAGKWIPLCTSYTRTLHLHTLWVKSQRSARKRKTSPPSKVGRTLDVLIRQTTSIQVSNDCFNC